MALIIFKHLTAFRRLQPTPSRAQQKLTSNPAMRCGKFAEPSVLHQRDVILKGTLLV
jgi:hypothetical protein